MEIACELHASLTKLCRKYHYPRSKVHVQLIQNGKELGGLDLNGSVLIKERLQKLGVCLYCDYHITKVTPEKVEILDAQKVRKTLPSELLIWTAGVRVNPLLENLADSKSQGAIRVNSSLQSVGHDRIFAAGDNAYLSNPRHSGSRFPMLASVAKLQGALVAENIIRIIKSRPLLSFKPGFEWLLLLSVENLVSSKRAPSFYGIFAWLIRRFVILRYHLSILPFLGHFENGGFRKSCL